MNKIILMGRLTSDPDYKTGSGPNAYEVTRFNLAVDRPYTKKEGKESVTDFFRCEVWNKQASIANKYLHKGTKILLDGFVKLGSYTNKDGQKVNTTDVHVEHFEFAESKNAGQGGGNASTPSTENTQWMDVPDAIGEELPFN